MTKVTVRQLIDDVCKARGLSLEDLRDKSQRGSRVTLARRAIAVLFWDKYGMTGPSNHQVTWVWIADYLNMSRSSLIDAARKWSKMEGSQDEQKEEYARKKGRLLPKGKESLHQVAKRVCKRSTRSMPKGRRRELGYWWSKEEVSKKGVNYG
jgi:hypothetical protein